MFLLIISLSLTLSQLLLHHIQLLLTHLSNVELPFFSFLTVNADLLVFPFSFQNTDGTLEAASRAWSSRWDWGSSSNRNQRHLRQNTALQQRSVLKLNHETSHKCAARLAGLSCYHYIHLGAVLSSKFIYMPTKSLFVEEVVPAQVRVPKRGSAGGSGRLLLNFVFIFFSVTFFYITKLTLKIVLLILLV